MPRRFDDNPTLPMRGLQIWQILIAAAHARQTVRYGKLAKMLEYGGAGTLARMLGHVFFWCRDNELPFLTVLVVNQDSGVPGEGFEELTRGLDLNVERERVYDFDWYGLVPPTPEELSTDYARNQPAYVAARASSHSTHSSI
jgi:hypothetical protein